MPTVETLLAFALVAAALAMTPGPNMIYLLSRTLSQGRRAAYVSLVGVGVGFLVYMTLAALGITAVLLAVPFAYDALRIAGAIYLLYLAWKIATGETGLDTRRLEPHSDRRLFAMGLVTNLLNPKAAMLYLSLLPQFVDPARGDVLMQGIVLGCLQIALSMIANGTVIATAGTLANGLKSRPRVARLQRYVTGTVLGVMAAQLALEKARR
jgi:threonine/homoserine/homoserine lactone efflux protein